jgi:phosphatidylserine/phosphatidylglycerophosphate/cardiolipin synthase-like enzyme
MRKNPLFAILFVLITLGCTSRQMAEFIFPGACDEPCNCDVCEACGSEGTIDVTFCQEESCADLLISHIESSNDTIYLAIYSFTSSDILAALISADRRGIKVYGILEPSQNSIVDDLFSVVDGKRGPVFDYVYRTGTGIMHNKILVVDDTVVCTGSYNWSNNAENNNDENLVCITSPVIVEEYKQYLQDLYEVYQ